MCPFQITLLLQRNMWKLAKSNFCLAKSVSSSSETAASCTIVVTQLRVESLFSDMLCFKIGVGKHMWLSNILYIVSVAPAEAFRSGVFLLFILKLAEKYLP